MHAAGRSQRAVRPEQHVYPAVPDVLRNGQHHDGGSVRNGVQPGQHHGAQPGDVPDGGAARGALRLLDDAVVQLHELLPVEVQSAGCAGGVLLGPRVEHDAVRSGVHAGWNLADVAQQLHDHDHKL